jgi:translation initiation factor 5B
LFIDTPGHHSFVTLRARGGSLADLAVLVIDIREGLMPQTIESIRILRQYKTPFVIALNKVVTIQGWQFEEGRPFILSEKIQQSHTLEAFNEKLYKVIEQLSYEGISADRYDRIDDFTKAVALVPISAKEGEGVPDLLLVLIGLAQRFLESQLEKGQGPGKGTILEIKEEKGLGKTMDMILYSGTIKKGDTVAIGTRGAPLVTKIKAILKPKPLDEIRDPRDRFDSVKELNAAAGVSLARRMASKYLPMLLSSCGTFKPPGAVILIWVTAPASFSSSLMPASSSLARSSAILPCLSQRQKRDWEPRKANAS